MEKTSTPMLEQIHSLPAMVRDILPSFQEAAEEVLTPALCASLQSIYLVGCGDSHMAALGGELAFHTLAGMPTRAMMALHFSRYTVPFLAEPQTTAVIGISVSGEVARTIESVRLANKVGAVTMGITGAPHSRLAHSAHHVLKTSLPPPPTPVPTPGVRSYIASLLMLYLAAIRIGEVRGFLSSVAVQTAYRELEAVPDAIEATVQANEGAIQNLVTSWKDAQEFVFVGGGPNYGTALFSAAKLLEASGDSALGQDTEEWTHLQYFARAVDTPTFFIDAGGRSNSRACEAAVAAKAIGRRVAAVVPVGEAVISAQAEAVLPVHGKVREAFSPLLYGLAGMLFAEYRTQLLGEKYFRAFGGGRSIEGGGGISRIQTSELQEEVLP